MEVNMSRTKNFSIDEDAYIRNNYRNLFDEEIAEVLNRPVGSITRRRQRLGCWHVQQEVSASVGGEIWVQIKDLPSGYMVSNMGRIKSGNKLCTLYIRKSGYVQWRAISLSSGYARTYKVHRLVAEHFCKTDKCLTECHVHHIDGNPQNNAAYNLEWLLPSEHKLKH